MVFSMQSVTAICDCSLLLLLSRSAFPLDKNSCTYCSSPFNRSGYGRDAVGLSRVGIKDLLMALCDTLHALQMKGVV